MSIDANSLKDFGLTTPEEDEILAKEVLQSIALLRQDRLNQAAKGAQAVLCALCGKHWDPAVINMVHET